MTVPLDAQKDYIMDETTATATTEKIDSLTSEEIEVDFYELMGVIVVVDMDAPALVAWQASHSQEAA